MHAKQLAALGGWIASQADTMIQGHHISLINQADYWIHSKARFHRWHGALKMFHSDLTDPQPAHNPWPAIELVVQEVISSELLTRVWGTILTRCDQLSGESQFAGIASGTFVGHIEVRNRATQLLLRGPDSYQHVVVELQRHANRIERWTDLWLSLIDPIEQSSKFAFKPERVNDFRLDQEQSQLNTEASSLSKCDEAGLMWTSFVSGLKLEMQQHPANPDLNHSIAASIVSALPDPSFDPMIMPAAAWEISMEQSCATAESLVGKLLQQ